MRLRRNIIIIIMFFVFLTSFFAVYFTLKYNTSSKIKIAVDNSSKSTNSSLEALINEKTEIVKTYKYKGNIEKKLIEKPGPELLGFNRKDAIEYFKVKKFLLTEFSNDRVSLLLDTDTWAPNYYVIKCDATSVSVYHVNDKSELILEYIDTNLKPQDLPTEDRKLFEAGKVYKTLQDANNQLEELES